MTVRIIFETFLLRLLTPSSNDNFDADDGSGEVPISINSVASVPAFAFNALLKNEK